MGLISISRPPIAAGRRAFFLTFSITQRDAPPDAAAATSPGLVALVGEVPVDVAGDRRSRGDKITPDQARPMRQMSAPTPRPDVWG